jgi:hypothetical protein
MAKKCDSPKILGEIGFLGFLRLLPFAAFVAKSRDDDR